MVSATHIRILISLLFSFLACWDAESFGFTPRNAPVVVSRGMAVNKLPNYLTQRISQKSPEFVALGSAPTCRKLHGSLFIMKEASERPDANVTEEDMGITTVEEMKTEDLKRYFGALVQQNAILTQEKEDLLEKVAQVQNKIMNKTNNNCWKKLHSCKICSFFIYEQNQDLKTQVHTLQAQNDMLKMENDMLRKTLTTFIDIKDMQATVKDLQQKQNQLDADIKDLQQKVIHLETAIKDLQQKVIHREEKEIHLEMAIKDLQQEKIQREALLFTADLIEMIRFYFADTVVNGWKPFLDTYSSWECDVDDGVKTKQQFAGFLSTYNNRMHGLKVEDLVEAERDRNEVSYTKINKVEDQKNFLKAMQKFVSNPDTIKAIHPKALTFITNMLKILETFQLKHLRLPVN